MTHYSTTVELMGQNFTLEVWHDQDDGETVVGVYGAGGECQLDVLYLDISWQMALAKAICLHHHHLLVTG